MTGISEWSIERRRPTFSFYLTAHKCKVDPGTALRAARLADSITVAGAKGPKIVRQLRTAGLDAPARFDGLGYSTDEPIDAAQWIQLQREADATELLLPGVLVPWNQGDHAALKAVIWQQGRIAGDLGASLLLALDARWIARGADRLIDSMLEAARPVALVLAHRADPLSEVGAVSELRRICARVPNLSVLRSDHGAVGALAFGARHAAMGLTTSTRHYAGASKGAWRRPGTAARVFVRLLLDWFLASDIAGWTAAGNLLACRLPCCGGRSLDRFLDPQNEVTIHNMMALADFARFVISAEPVDRAAGFLRACQEATSRYGLAGLHGPENPKPQLTSWVFS